MLSSLYTILIISHFRLILGDLTKVVDLTWDFGNDTIYWVGISPFTYTKIVANDQERGYWYAMNEFCAGEHGGTHFDAPYHFNKAGWKVGEVPIDRLIAKGAYLDVTGNATLLVDHLNKWVEENGQFEDNTVLLVKFGRSKFWPNTTLYMGIDEEGNRNFEGLSVDAAKWITQSGKIVGVGVDTPSIDPGSSVDFMVHRVLAKAQIYGMENVKMVEQLPAKGFTLVVSPMKLREGTGAPLRLIAVPKGFF